MLCHFSIRHFVNIHNLELNFYPGFSVITGETGIGKSLIFDALSVVLGKPLEKKFIKNHKKTMIEAHFNRMESFSHFLKECNIPDQDIWIFRREDKLYLNGIIVSSKWMRRFSENFITLHEQKSEWDFMKLLDASLETEPVQNAYALYDNEKRKYETYLQQKRVFEEQEAYWQMAKELLEEVKPEPNEEEKLLEERVSFHKVGQMIQDIDHLQNDFEQPNDLLSHLRKMMRSCPQDFLKDLEIAHSHLFDLQEKIKDIKEQHEYAAERLNYIDERLNVLRMTAKKLRTTTDHLYDFLRPMETLQTYDKNVLEKALHSYEREACLLSEKRKEKAEQILASLHHRLPSLKLEKMRLNLNHDLRNDPHLQGKDSFQLLCSTHHDFPFMPVDKIASGGEVSRLQLLLQSFDSKSTILFDEIDTGISGNIALAVGQTLRNLEHQVIAITHSPQVASCADHHYVVYEKSVDYLDTKEKKLHAIATLFSSVTDVTLAAARELHESHS